MWLFISPDKVAPSPISIPQENKPPGPPTKSAPPTGHLKPAPTTKLDNNKPTQCKPANPIKGSKRSKLADCNSPHPTQENKPPPSKSAPPTGHLKPAPTTNLDNNKPTQCKPASPIKGSKQLKLAECNSPRPTQENKPPPSKSAPLKPAPNTNLDNKLAECNSPHSTQENEPSAPPAKRLKLDINTQANPLFNDRDRTTLLSGGWLSDRHMNVTRKLMAQKFPSQHGLQDTLITLDKFDRYQSSNEKFVQLINVAGNH